MVIAGNGDAIFKRLMAAIGREDLSNDPELARNDGRVTQNDKLDAAITSWTSQRELEDVLKIMEAAEVPCGRVYTAADIAADPHYKVLEMIQQHRLPDGSAIELPGIVPKLSATPGQTRWVGPRLGEHTQEVLGSVGIDAASFEGLRARGIV